MIKISPSVLACDFAELGREIRSVEAGGADYIHIDVMDGNFVPNISVGVPVVAAARRATRLPLDVHLMIERPARYIDAFAQAGADIIVFHIEADVPQKILEALRRTRELGRRAGLSLKPGTPASALEPYLPLLDMALVMTVEPGFGGQSFMDSQLEKISAVRAMISAGGFACDLEVDGGINEATARLCAAAGANVLVAGSAVFGGTDRAGNIRKLRG